MKTLLLLTCSAIVIVIGVMVAPYSIGLSIFLCVMGFVGGTAPAVYDRIIRPRLSK